MVVLLLVEASKHLFCSFRGQGWISVGTSIRVGRQSISDLIKVPHIKTKRDFQWQSKQSIEVTFVHLVFASVHCKPLDDDLLANSPSSHHV